MCVKRAAIGVNMELWEKPDAVAKSIDEIKATHHGRDMQVGWTFPCEGRRVHMKISGLIRGSVRASRI